MKTLMNMIGITGLAALVCVGCQQSDSTSIDPGTSEEVVEVETATIEETVTETAETAKKAISEANAKAQELLTQAQNLVSDKKYEEASSLFQKLSDFELTPEQQKMLDELKAVVQKAMESEAVKEGTKAIGNMLGGEK